MTVEQLLRKMIENDCSLSVYTDKLNDKVKIQLSGVVDGRILKAEVSLPKQKVEFGNSHIMEDRLNELLRIFRNRIANLPKP